MECNEKFLVTGRRHEYCSRRCQQAAYRRNKPESSTEYVKQWRKDNLDHSRELAHAGNQKLQRHRREIREELFEKQNGLCYLCEKPVILKDNLACIDHDHSCCSDRRRSCENCRRGLACWHCNLILGHAKDDPARLRLIADNLERITNEKKARLKPISS